MTCRWMSSHSAWLVHGEVLSMSLKGAILIILAIGFRPFGLDQGTRDSIFAHRLAQIKTIVLMEMQTFLPIDSPTFEYLNYFDRILIHIGMLSMSTKK